MMGRNQAMSEGNPQPPENCLQSFPCTANQIGERFLGHFAVLLLVTILSKNPPPLPWEMVKCSDKQIADNFREPTWVREKFPYSDNIVPGTGCMQRGFTYKTTGGKSTVYLTTSALRLSKYTKQPKISPMSKLQILSNSKSYIDLNKFIWSCIGMTAYE